jgi:formamidopyrimidine-DNA glycosylase
MPELPEVETVRRCIEPVLSGAVIERIDIRRDRMARRQPNPDDIVNRLEGGRITGLGRRGKLLMLDVGGGDFVWVLHLGMSGRLAFADGSTPPPHTNVVVTHDNGPDLWFIDPRTFGFTAVYTHEEFRESPLAAIGPDALWELPSVATFLTAFDGRTAPIKSVLLGQRVVAGLGNIYVDEILFSARVHPRRPCGDLSPDEVTAIRSCVRPVLEAGIAAGGTSLNDLAYLLPDGRAGEFLMQLRAYGRAGEPCHRCGTVLEHTTVAQRSTTFCPACQI